MEQLQAIENLALILNPQYYRQGLYLMEDILAQVVIRALTNQVEVAVTTIKLIVLYLSVALKRTSLKSLLSITITHSMKTRKRCVRTQMNVNSKITVLAKIINNKIRMATTTLTVTMQPLRIMITVITVARAQTHLTIYSTPEGQVTKLSKLFKSL